MSVAHTSRPIITFGAINQKPVATSDLFNVCNQNSNLPIVLLPTHGQRPPPKLSAASKQLISKESVARQEAAVQKHVADKKKKKAAPPIVSSISDSQTQKQAPVPKQKQASTTMTDIEEFEDIGAEDSVDDEQTDEIDDDLKEYLSEDTDEEDDARGSAETDDFEDDDVNDKVPAAVVVQVAKKARTVAGSAKATAKADTQASSRKKRANSKNADPMREQNKVALLAEKNKFGTDEAKIVRQDHVRRVCFAIAYDVVKAQIPEMQKGKKFRGSLYQSLFALADRANAPEKVFKWFGNLKSTAVSKSIKTIVETFFRIRRIVEVIEPKCATARLDLLADVVAVDVLPESAEAVGDDVVKCEILGMPIQRMHTTNLQTTHQNGHKGQLRVCSKLYEGTTAIVGMNSFPAGLITLCSERYQKKANGKSRGKTSIGNIVLGTSTLSEGVKKMIDDTTSNSFLARANMYVFNIAKNMFQLVSRFEAARKLVLTTVDPTAALATIPTLNGAQLVGPMSVNGEQPDFIDLDVEDDGDDDDDVVQLNGDPDNEDQTTVMATANAQDDDEL